MSAEAKVDLFTRLGQLGENDQLDAMKIFEDLEPDSLICDNPKEV